MFKQLLLSMLTLCSVCIIHCNSVSAFVSVDVPKITQEVSQELQKTLKKTVDETIDGVQKNINKQVGGVKQTIDNNIIDIKQKIAEIQETFNLIVKLLAILIVFMSISTTAIVIILLIRLTKFVSFIIKINVARITNIMAKSLQIINTKSMQVGTTF